MKYDASQQFRLWRDDVVFVAVHSLSRSMISLDVIPTSRYFNLIDIRDMGATIRSSG